MSLSRSPIFTRNRNIIISQQNQAMEAELQNQNRVQPLLDLQHPPQVENVGSANLKLPSFYNKYPCQWFAIAETQFRIRNVNNENSKYECLMLALSQDLIASVFDIIQSINDNWNNPNSTPYTTLKEALLERNSLSESQRLESLLKDVDIGDRKPSEFYRALKQTAGQSDSISDKLITQLWMRKLPTQIQVSLKTLPNPDIKTLLSMADSIYEIIQTNNQGQVQAIFSSFEQPQHDHISRLENQIKILTETIEKLNTHPNYSNTHPNSSNRSRSRYRSRSKSNTNQSNSSGICWYHDKFGTKAKKCISPCNFTKNQ